MNKLNKISVQNYPSKIFLLILFFGTIFQLQAQERLPFDQGKKYILANVKVIRTNSSFEENLAIVFIMQI